MLFNVCVGEKCRNKEKPDLYSKRISQLWLFRLLAVAQLACCSRARGRLLHAEHLNVGNGSFRSFNGVSVFVCERELSEEGGGGKWRDGR